MAWYLEFSREARNFFQDNGSLVADLWFELEALLETDGIPLKGGATQFVQGELIADLASYMVAYERDEKLGRLRIISIKPH